MLLPKRTKYRKQQRGRMKGKAMRGNYVSYGEYGITQPSCHVNRRAFACQSFLLLPPKSIMSLSSCTRARAVAAT